MCKDSESQKIIFAWAKNAPPAVLPKGKLIFHFIQDRSEGSCFLVINWFLVEMWILVWDNHQHSEDYSLHSDLSPGTLFLNMVSECDIASLEDGVKY